VTPRGEKEGGARRPLLGEGVEEARGRSLVKKEEERAAIARRRGGGTAWGHCGHCIAIASK
jgi:hypothetical protein